MEEKYSNDGEKRQTEQEWQNIDNRQYFESMNNDNDYKIREAEPIEEKEAIKGELGNESIYNEKPYTSDMNIVFNHGVIMSRKVKFILVISWICAALTAFVSIYFAIPGIVFGFFSNRVAKGSGTAAIITNIVLAIVNIIIGLFMMVSLNRLFVFF